VKRSSTIAGGLAALALAGGLTMAIPGTARADGIVPNQPWTEVVPAFTDHLAGLDDPGGSATSGTPIQLFHCHGYGSDGEPQRWPCPTSPAATESRSSSSRATRAPTLDRRIVLPQNGTIWHTAAQVIE
jgi:hypothetical protein